MTDEELGRAWCQANNRRPDYRPKTGLPPYRWVSGDGPDCALPAEVFNRMSCGPSRYHTEADAYAAVGAAIREMAGDCRWMLNSLAPFLMSADLVRALDRLAQIGEGHHQPA